MKVALVTKWDNAWVPMFKEEIEHRGHQFALCDQPEPADVVIHGWAWTQPVKNARNVMFLRRYELFSGGLQKVDWSGIDQLICVNKWIEQVVSDSFNRKGVKTPVSTIYNAVDLKSWTFKERKHNKRIGMACHVHPKKNLPLALQILAALPDDYELHIAGEVQDPCTAEYLNAVAKAAKRSVYIYGHIERSELNAWWDMMGFCLSSSLSEGNPNNVIEAMAKGIKPLVHCWPGAEDQFPDHLFSTVDEAVKLMGGEYRSEKYRQEVEQKFSIKNIERVVDLCVS